MRFSNIAEEARPIAKALLKFYKSKRMQVRERWIWGDSNYCTTLCFMNFDLPVLAEAQGRLDYHNSLKGFVRWFSGRRHYGEIYIATSDQSSLPAKDLKELKDDGVGLLLVDVVGSVVSHQLSRNPALTVNPDPRLRYGVCTGEVLAAVKKFNEVNRKDGLRDLCEIFERQILELAIRASTKGYLKAPLEKIRAEDLNGLINMLYSPNAYNAGKVPLVDTVLHQDLHSFRGARNLVDHPVASRRDELRRQRQFADRMISGPRLLSDLHHLKSRIK